jgi:hypothetical protein
MKANLQRALSTQKSYRGSHLIADQSELVLLVSIKEIVHDLMPKHVVADEVMLFMALTFGTLLSSQGADAHHHAPFGSIWGNLCYATRSDSQCQTDLLVPRSPSICDFVPADSLWWPARPVPVSGSVRRARRTLAEAQTRVKSGVSAR